MLPITHIIKDMFTNRTRLILTILAVAWGTFSIASMLAVGEGLRITFGNVTNVGKEALIANGGMSTLEFRGQSSGVKVTLTQQDLDLLQQALASKAYVTGEVSWNKPLYYGKKSWMGPPVLAVGEDYAQIHHVNMEANGRFINPQDVKQHSRVIVLGNRVVKELFKQGENPIGKLVYLESKPFVVIGVQRKSLQLFSGSRISDDFISWIPITTYQELTSQRNYTDFIIAPFDLADVPLLQRQVLSIIAHSRQLYPQDPGILNFTNLQDQKQKLNLFLYGIEAVLGIIGGLTLVVAGVGIANVMYISVSRSTREIGIRMAIGAMTYEILGYYACEALLTTAIGGFLGLLLTKIVLLILNQIPMDSKLLQYFGSPKPLLSLNVVLIVIIALGAVGLLAGFFPARKAASIHPAEALRHEK